MSNDKVGPTESKVLGFTLGQPRLKLMEFKIKVTASKLLILKN